MTLRLYRVLDARAWSLAVVLAAGGVGCTATAGVEAEAQAPAPGLVYAEPDVWVVGDAAAPDQYYSDGYYWRFEEDHWYRRPPDNPTWLVVETRVVPQRIVIHEHDHHAAIVARERVRAAPAAQVRAERRSNVMEERQRQAERREDEAERQRQLNESRARLGAERERHERAREREQDHQERGRDRDHDREHDHGRH